MENLPIDRNRRSLWNFFRVEQGFKQRQIMQLLALTALNVAGSTAAFIALQHYEGAAHWAGAETSSLGLLRIAVGWAALMGGLGGLFALIVGVLTTHRVAGPIHKFKRELARIEAGESPRPIGVRSGDEFADLAEALTAALDALWARSGAPSADFDIERVRATHQQILEGVEALDPGVLAEPDRVRVEAWRDQMRALRDKLDSGSAPG